MSYDYGISAIASRQSIKTSRSLDASTQTIMGQSVLTNDCPQWTLNNGALTALSEPETGRMFGISKDMLSYGLLAIGAPGTGKTNFFNQVLKPLIGSLASNEVIFIFDTKGDYYSEFGQYIPTSEKIVIGNDLMYRDITGYHNIFAEVMPRGVDGKLVYTHESDEEALEICEQLFQQMKSDTQPIFPAMAEQIVTAVMIYFMRTYWRRDQSKLNNRELVRFLASCTNDTLKEIFDLEYMADQRSCKDYVERKSSQTQGVNSYVSTIIRKLFVGPFAQADPSKEFSMREIVNGNKRKVVFIEYDLRKGQLLSSMYGILIDRALANALGRREKRKPNRYFLLDEMLLLPKLEHMSDALNFGRSQNVKVICGVQNIAGLEEQYGKAGMTNILSSFQNMLAFRVTDYESRQFIINRLGTNYQNYHLCSGHKDLDVQREGHTVEDWDLLRLKDGEAVVSLIRSEPFVFQTALYK